MIKESKTRCLNLRSCKNLPSHPTPPLNPLSHQLSIHFSIISLLLSQFLYFLQSITSINAVLPHLLSTTEEMQPIFFFFLIISIHNTIFILLQYYKVYIRYNIYYLYQHLFYTITVIAVMTIVYCNYCWNNAISIICLLVVLIIYDLLQLHMFSFFCVLTTQKNVLFCKKCVILIL